MERAERRALKHHNPSQSMAALKRVWLAKGAVRIDPMPAYYCGTQPTTEPSTLGGLGVLDDTLVFGTAGDALKLRLPISALRWISCAVVKDSSLDGGTTTGLMLHVEQDAQWQIHAFRVSDPLAVGHLFHEVLGVPVMRAFDLGPAKVAVFEQDIYGHWNYQSRGVAYLAPDRLLIDGKTALHVADLRTIVVGPARGLSEVTAWLLRLSYQHGDGGLGGLGVQMPRAYAQRWADAMSSRSGVPVQVYDGRKGKGEKLAS
ncbi:hypothetical protein [Aggregatilinea lenta]|uniref:hypothetical protein n=1 Tax=Aggregatilinea lenta TaxID=913108 RepID=UPI000E5C1522|nr:hypothetical protein [Aggregatilinea lenta]